VAEVLGFGDFPDVAFGDATNWVPRVVVRKSVGSSPPKLREKLAGVRSMKLGRG
jgi:hypothetical protein